MNSEFAKNICVKNKKIPAFSTSVKNGEGKFWIKSVQLMLGST